MALTIIKGDYKDVITSQHAEREASPAIIWGLYDSDVATTQDTFEPVLEGQTLNELAQTIKNKLGILRAIDLMGQGSRLIELGVDEGLAVSLDFNEAKMKSDLNRDHLKLLASDLNTDRTWQLISSLIEPAGLVICTPGDGVRYAWDKPYLLEQKVEAFFSFVDDAIQLLAPGGTLLIESQGHPRIASIYANNQMYNNHSLSVTAVASPVLAVLKLTRS